MIRVTDPGLPQNLAVKLAAWQQYVDAAPTYVSQVERARTQFPLANRVGNATFAEIRQQLSAMCSGARRCMYCEDSVADEVEHHHPKDLYPEKTFTWTNFLYACGPCNGPKNNRFAILQGDKLLIVTRGRDDPIVPPQQGHHALIHPRFEDPLQFLLLDLYGRTFRFTPHPMCDNVSAQRATYTIDVLGLNRKDFLLVARREAFDSYLARLRDYSRARNEPQRQSEASAMHKAIVRMQHPTVFREMLRQASHLPELQPILSQAPEVASW